MIGYILDYTKVPMQLGHLYDNWQDVLSASEVNDIAGFDVQALADERNKK